MISSFRPLIRVALLACLLAGVAYTPSALAFDTGELDGFFLGGGSANIQVKNSKDLASGSSTFGGLRLGLFGTVFGELGYGAQEYSDRVQISGVTKRIDFRTTGANLGLGFVIPIREVALGAKYVTNPGNKWEQRQTDVATNTKDFGNSGTINFESYYVFARLGRWFEAGVRRDHISSGNSVLTNSFGPYIALTLPLSAKK